MYFQRSAGQSARNNYREESTDDDLPPKRHHRPKARSNPALERSRITTQRGSPNEGTSTSRGRMTANASEHSDSEENEDDDNHTNQRISSRGRIRKPNPRLMD